MIEWDRKEISRLFNVYLIVRERAERELAEHHTITEEFVKANEHLKRLQADLENYGINVW